MGSIGGNMKGEDDTAVRKEGRREGRGQESAQPSASGQRKWAGIYDRLLMGSEREKYLPI
jgi:hypothetical protein